MEPRQDSGQPRLAVRVVFDALAVPTSGIVFKRDPGVDLLLDTEPSLAAQRDVLGRRWDDLVQRPGARVWNKSKFRLGKIERSSDTGIVICVGLTDYRSYVCTNMSDSPPLLASLPVFASPIGNCAIVCTADHRVMLVRRSMQTVDYPGMLDAIGGHPEPDDVDDLTDASQLFDELHAGSILREVQEEMNLAPADIVACRLMGVVENVENHGKPDLCFAVLTRLSAAEVVRQYNQGGEDAWESSALHHYSASLDQEFPPDSQLAPAAQGAVQLWRRVLQHVPDREELLSFLQC